MAIQPRVATLLLQGTAGNSRRWDAIATVQDTAHGGQVVIDISWSSNGAVPPNTETTFEVIIELPDSSTVVRTFSMTPSDNGSTSVDFYFTVDGAIGTSPRCGVVEIVIRVVRTGGLAGTNYDIRSDRSTGNTLPTGFTLDIRDQGWIRGTTTLTSTLSNISFGGGMIGGTNLFAYPDSIFARGVLGAQPYKSESLTLTVRQSVSPFTSYLSQSVASATATFQHQFTSVPDNRFPVAVTNVRVSASVPNDTFAGVPWTTITSSTLQTMDADPRLTFTHLFQIEDNTYGTPPMSKNDATGQRLTAKRAFLSERITNARSEGVNGVQWSTSLQDQSAAPEAAITKAASSSVARGGENGWHPNFLTWSSQLPAGTWRKTNTVTSPALTVGLDSNKTIDYTLLAQDPSIRLILGGGVAGTNDQGDHWHPGEPLLVGCVLFNTATKKVETADGEANVPTIAIARFNVSFGIAQYLDAAYAWQNVGTGEVHFFALSPSPGDARIYIRQFTAEQTAAMGFHDLFLVGQARLGGTPYTFQGTVDSLSDINLHDLYAFDAIGLSK